MDTAILVPLIAVAVSVGVFLACRSIVLWYFKISRLVHGVETTNELLAEILGTLRRDS